VGAADAKEAVVRFSLDLSSAEHQFQKRFAYDNDVPQSQVGRGGSLRGDRPDRLA
jgi:hypothetical protein